MKREMSENPRPEIAASDHAWNTRSRSSGWTTFDHPLPIASCSLNPQIVWQLALV